MEYEPNSMEAYNCILCELFNNISNIIFIKKKVKFFFFFYYFYFYNNLNILHNK